MVTTSAIRKVLPHLEFGYAVIALFALTQGPVYQLWNESGLRLDILPSPSIAHVHFATFLVIQMPGVVLWLRRVDAGWLRILPNQALLAFLCWLGLSVVWSTFARQSLPEFLALVLTSFFGLYLTSSFSRLQLWLIVTLGMATGLISSWWAIVRVWPAALNVESGYWVGIYYNRNSLAPVATMAILGSVGVFLTLPKKYRMVLSTYAASMIVAGFIFLLKSQSRTSLIALALAVVSILSYWFLTHIRRPRKLANLIKQWSVSLVLFVTMVSTFLAIRLVLSSSRLPNDLVFFNSRQQVWSVNWSGILEKPIVGWGWMAAWYNPDFKKLGEWWVLWETQWSHNSYHDILLGGGAIAAILFCCFIVAASKLIGSETSRSNHVIVVGSTTVILVSATQESFFVGSHFLWALLICQLGSYNRDLGLSV